MPDDFESIGTLDALPEGRPVAFSLSNGEPICLVRRGDAVFAFQSCCTHAQFDLSEGEMVDEYVIECALHAAQFDVRDGKVVSLPAEIPLGTYGVRVENGQVQVGGRR